MAVVTPTVDGDVLTVLARADGQFTPPQVQALIGDHSVEGVRRVLNRLAEQGIVSAERHGNATSYRLNRDHLAADAIIALASQRGELVRRMTALASSWRPRAVYVGLFGSAATGRMHPASDIDVFVVRPESVDPDDDRWNGQARELTALVGRWTGNDVRLLEYAEADLEADADAVLDDVRREGITLHGALPRKKTTDGPARTPDKNVRRRNSQRATGQGRAVRRRS